MNEAGSELLMGRAHRTEAAAPALRDGRIARVSIVRVNMSIK